MSRRVECHCLLFVWSPPTLLNYSHYILCGHARVQLICRIEMLEFSVCAFTAFLRLACDGVVCAERSSGFHRIWDSGMLESPPSGVCEILEKMGVMEVLQNSMFDVALEYMVFCCSLDTDWRRCTSLWFPYDFHTHEVSDVLLCKGLPTSRRDGDGDIIDDVIVSAFSVLFEPGDLTPIPPGQGQGALVAV